LEGKKKVVSAAQVEAGARERVGGVRVEDQKERKSSK